MKALEFIWEMPARVIKVFLGRRLMLALVMLFAGLWLAVGCSSDGPQPTLTGQQKTTAVNQITALDEVLDALIDQPNKKTLSLAVIVNFGTSKDRARDVGESFVRIVKSLGPDNAPGQQIGSGIYDYEIMVLYPNRTTVVQGAKVQDVTRISW